MRAGTVLATFISGILGIYPPSLDSRYDCSTCYCTREQMISLPLAKEMQLKRTAPQPTAHPAISSIQSGRPLSPAYMRQAVSGAAPTPLGARKVNCHCHELTRRQWVEGVVEQ